MSMVSDAARRAANAKEFTSVKKVMGEVLDDDAATHEALRAIDRRYFWSSFKGCFWALTAFETMRLVARIVTMYW